MGQASSSYEVSPSEASPKSFKRRRSVPAFAFRGRATDGHPFLSESHSQKSLSIDAEREEERRSSVREECRRMGRSGYSSARRKLSSMSAAEERRAFRAAVQHTDFVTPFDLRKMMEKQKSRDEEKTIGTTGAESYEKRQLERESDQKPRQLRKQSSASNDSGVLSLPSLTARIASSDSDSDLDDENKVELEVSSSISSRVLRQSYKDKTERKKLHGKGIFSKSAGLMTPAIQSESVNESSKENSERRISVKKGMFTRSAVPRRLRSKSLGALIRSLSTG